MRVYIFRRVSIDSADYIYSDSLHDTRLDMVFSVA